CTRPWPPRPRPARPATSRSSPTRTRELLAAGSAGFVRPARSGDADDLARIQVASWLCTLAGIVPSGLLGELTGPEASAVWRDRWREAIGNPPTSRHRVLAAVTDSMPREVVGFV